MKKRFDYRLKYKRRSTSRWIAIAAIAATAVIVIGLAANAWYNRNLAAVDSSSSAQINFTVVTGSTVHDIGIDLKRANLIRSTQAFETYVRGRGLFDKLQAGTYGLSKALSTPQIVDKMVNGDVVKGLLTILPGKTLQQIRQAFKDAGYNDAELDIAFSPVTYSGHPALAGVPTSASLEGLLYPDSYQKISTTLPTAIIRQSLDEMAKKLTADIRSGFKAQGLNTYQGITLASIVYAESGSPQTEPTIAQVFLKRLKQDMLLQSDPTAWYASAKAGVSRSLSIESPYNTYRHKGLPPGPIGNMAEAALKAVAHPSKTDYLYFVAGDDGVTHFSHTQEEHERAVAKYCHEQCG